MHKIPLVVVAGPTASGKTALSIEIAKRYNGAIISADSMQIYKRMNIGTAKPTPEEMDGIEHYMLDVAEPDEEFNVALYAEMAKQCIKSVYDSGKLPVMVGGTGLYIDNILQNISLAEAQVDIKLREQLESEAEKHGNEYVHTLLAKVDAQAAENIHPNNVRRVIRALEVYYTTGNTFTHQVQNSKLEESPYESIVFMPCWDRKMLYERIDRRVDIMFENGLLDEFCSLVKAGYKYSLNSMQAIGYKELFDWHRGLCTFDEAKELIKRHSRRYAKRQLTWFKRNKSIISLSAQSENMAEQCFEYIDRWIKNV